MDLSGYRHAAATWDFYRNRDDQIGVNGVNQERLRALIKSERIIRGVKEHWPAAAMLLFLLFYALLFLAPQSGREEIIVEAGQESFEASLSRIEAVIPCNNDVKRQQLLDENGAEVTIVIRDAAGSEAARLTIADGELHTNGYNSTENLQAEGLPFTLEIGQTYYLEYEADCDGIPLTELSFALYGGEHRLPVLLGAALALLLCVLVIFRFCGASDGEGCSARGYRLLWLALTGIFLISIPKMNESASERTAFADAYAASNILLGKEAADADGYVYVEESGIRNMGYLSYSVPLHRFWSDWESGNRREEGKISSLYRTDRTGAGSFTAFSFIDGALIALLRLWKAPYQLIYLSGRLLHAALCGLLLCVFLSVWEKGKTRREKVPTGRQRVSCVYEFLPVLFLLPSMLQGGLSYRWRSVLIAGWLTAALFLWNKGKKRLLACAVLLPAGVLLLQGAMQTLRGGENVLRALVCAIMTHADGWLLGLAGCYSISPEALRFPVLLLECALGYVPVLRPVRSRRREERLFLLVLCLIVYIGWKCAA